jgi:hypothetical protein
LTVTTDAIAAPLTEKAPTSVAERFVPSLSYALAAISGPIGALLVQQFFSTLRTAENAGYAAFFGGLARIEMIIGGVLAIAAFLGFAAVVAALARLFVPRKRPSPPGSVLFFAGLISLIPAGLVLYSMQTAAAVVTSGSRGGVSAVAGTIMTTLYIAAGIAALIVIGLVAFCLVPFRARPGRKYTTLIGLLLAEILIISLSVKFFLEAGAMHSLITSG